MTESTPDRPDFTRADSTAGFGQPPASGQHLDSAAMTGAAIHQSTRPATPAAPSPWKTTPPQQFVGPQPHTGPTTAPTHPAFQQTPVRERRRGNLRAMVAAASLAALLGAGTGIGSYALLQPNSTGSGVSVTAANAPAAAQLDGTVQAAAKKISPSTVTIEVRTSQGAAIGTGVILNTAGDILTNQHVIDGAGNGGRISVTLDDGTVLGASVVGQSATTDLAVIKLDSVPGTLTPATFADSSSVQVGQSVVAVGAPLGLSKTVTAGVVSNTARPVRSGLSGNAVYQAVQTDAAINPGNSGGPLVDLNGDIVGINSSIATTGSSGGSGESSESGNIGIGFAIPSTVASRVADEIIRTGHATDASLGVSISGGSSGGGSNGGASSDPAGGAAADETSDGATVAEVTAGSAAAKAGLEAGDVITKVGDTPTPDADALIAAIRFQSVGATVAITWTRDGQSHTADATLGAAS